MVRHVTCYMSNAIGNVLVLLTQRVDLGYEQSRLDTITCAEKSVMALNTKVLKSMIHYIAGYAPIIMKVTPQNCSKLHSTVM